MIRRVGPSDPDAAASHGALELGLRLADEPLDLKPLMLRLTTLPFFLRLFHRANRIGVRGSSQTCDLGAM